MSVRNFRLDSLRGIAAFAVLVHHSIHVGYSGIVGRVLMPALSDVPTSELPTRAVLSIASGGMAVYLFFILSGAVLINSLKNEPAINLAAVIRFCGRRLFRIYPAMIFAVIAFGAASWVSMPAFHAAPFSLSAILDNCLLISNSVNGATWTLQVEMLMVPAILAIAIITRIVGPLALVPYLIYGIVAIFNGAPIDILRVAVLAFGLGMAVPSEFARRVFSRFSTAWAYGFLLGMIAIRFYASLNDLYALVAILILGFCAVATLYHGKSAVRLFDMPAVLFLGRISYSVYLLQVPVIYELFPYYQQTVGTDVLARHYLLFGLLYTVIIAAVTIPLSAVVERYVEAPFIRSSHKIFARGPTLKTRAAIIAAPAG